MTSTSTATLTNLQGEQVALTHVDIDAEIVDLISRVKISQTYKNTEENNIEAVYTFPLPVDAVLLDLTVTLGNKVLKGKIVEKTEAEENYEEAITDGDSAIMLEESQPGTFTMNVGNLLADETIVISFTYGVLHQYQNKSLRFMMPTTLAPRHGNPRQSGLQEHQIPEHTLASSYGFNMTLLVKGLLTSANIESPTHKISIEAVDTSGDQNDKRVEICLKDSIAAMDRDFVINFTKIGVATSSARIEKDHYGYVSLASFLCDFDIDEDTSPRSFKVLVDCSGSMTGDSIAQVKLALDKMLLSVRDGDYINIIRFGSKYSMMAPEQLCVNQSNRQIISKYIQTVNADMGGTEMASALSATYAISRNLDMAHDVLLITDGEVWNSEDMIRDAINSQHRIFTIGVGSSVAENIVRKLAETTGGICELVTPNESMSDKVYRHFKRMHSPRAKSVDVKWPTTPSFSSPKAIQTVYDGDTLHAFAWFDEAPCGDVVLSITLPDGSIIEEHSQCELSENTDEDYFLARMGIARSLRKSVSNKNKYFNEKESELALYQNKLKEELAVEYQLMTAWTNYLVIHERSEEEQATDLPELRKVPQTLAAGWGGIGSVSDGWRKGKTMYAQPKVLMELSLDSQMYSFPSFLLSSKVDRTFENSVVKTGVVESISEYKTLSIDELNQFIKRLDVKLQKMVMTNFSSINIQYLEALGMPAELSESVSLALNDSYEEQDIVLVILYLLSEYEDASALHRHAIRLIKWRVKNTDIEDFDSISDYFHEIKASSCVDEEPV